MSNYFNFFVLEIPQIERSRVTYLIKIRQFHRTKCDNQFSFFSLRSPQYVQTVKFDANLGEIEQESCDRQIDLFICGENID